MLRIAGNVAVPAAEIEISAVRSQGAGGQNVNKVASAVHLRFDIRASSLPEAYKERLLALADQRITKEGVVIIKAQEFRSREKNREEALRRLRVLLRRAASSPPRRIPTKPSAAARRKRLEDKVKRGRLKAMRSKPPE